ncbi:MAG: response regulator, partial [Alphaproteobacteria bacterium]
LLHIQHDRLGNLTWRASGAPILDEQGKFAGYRGSVQDISNEVTAEQATRMQSLVMKGMSESVLIISADDVNTAVSGPDALRLIETEDIQPTILLTDVKMPDGMTGCDLANAIRKMTPDCQVIIMPGNSIDTLKDTQSGPEGSIYIQKPFSKQVLGGKFAEAAEIVN